MEKKGTIQLSINMIITIVIAFVFLGVAIFFITTFKPDIPIPGTCDTFPPTAENPVCILSSLELKRGREHTLQFSFYNDEDAEVPSTTKPTIECSPALSLELNINPQAVPVNDKRDFSMSLKPASDSERRTYQCTVTMSESSVPLTITVT